MTSPQGLATFCLFIELGCANFIFSVIHSKILFFLLSNFLLERLLNLWS